MARTHSSHTASPTRFRSPRRSPARRASQDGSQYEMDLDALGLNSTFESTELEGGHEPPADRIDSSDIEGPEDFTMNMTYWMTADLPLAQIKSRKEANARKLEARTDLGKDQNETQDMTADNDQALVEESSPDPKEYTASPTMRANGTTADREYSTPASERSMENDEKVRSFLSALPDTDMEGALTGTPLLIRKESFLQVPRSSPPKARSLQATVEDYDTPRKPTQETVIHHTSAVIDTTAQDALRSQFAGLQSRLECQELAAKTRITQLETILSYTHAELESARTNNFRHRERIASLEASLEQRIAEQEAAHLSAEAELRAQKDAMDAKLREYGEEMRLQNVAKLQKQKEDFEQQLQRRESDGQGLREVAVDQSELVKIEGNMSLEQKRLAEQLSVVQARADSLTAQLARTTSEAKAAREDAKRNHATHVAVKAESRAQATRISDLEGQVQAARFELECAQADIAAKQQLFQSNLDLNTRIRTLQAELDKARMSSTSDNQLSLQETAFEARTKSLQTQLESVRTDLDTKDHELLRNIQSQEQLEHRLHTSQGRIDGLETTINTLRQQLAEAHRDSARVRVEAERFERDLEDSNDRLQNSRAEANRQVADIEKRVSDLRDSKLEAEDKVKALQARCDDLIDGHEAIIEDVRDKAEDAVRKAGALLEQERRNKNRVIKDLKKTRGEMEKLRAESAQKIVEEDTSDEDGSGSIAAATPDAKDVEISTLRDLIRKQVAEMKTVRTETAALRKDNKKLKATFDSHSDLKDTMAALESRLTTLRTENSILQSRLKTQESDFEAVNKAMDEKLASMLSKLMKERAKTVVGKRDGQWAATVSKVQTEKELLGKVLLRQWGREEVGIADEKSGERQQYAYQYIKRS